MTGRRSVPPIGSSAGLSTCPGCGRGSLVHATQTEREQCEDEGAGAFRSVVTIDPEWSKRAADYLSDGR